MPDNDKEKINQLINELSTDVNKDVKETVIILAAGHGKRIKSQKSKMLHKIWDVPTVERVYNACKQAIDKETMVMLRDEFIKTKSDMLVLTGHFDGNPHENFYGRIIRAKDFDEKGNPSGNDKAKVIEIMEHKDILALDDNKPYKIKFNGKTYSYIKKELLENNEFNSGVYAFDFKKLTSLINSLSSDNVQNEIYITEMISLFNKKGYSVKAISPAKPHVVMGFNNKSVLKEMENLARSQVY